MDTYSDDLAALFEKLDLKNAIMVGHSTGGGEVARYLGRHGAKRVAKAVLVSAVPPLMLKTEKNPGGLPTSVFDGIRAGVAGNRAQFYKDITLPFYGYNRPGAKISEGIREHWWLQGMMGGIKAHYDCIKAFSETDFTEDLKKIEVPVLVMHGDDDQIVPIGAAGLMSAKILKKATLKVYPAFHTGCRRPTRTRSTPISWPSSKVSQRRQRGGELMDIDKGDTAVVFIDPQNEVLSERGLAWPLVRESLQENNTIGNIERIFKAAKARGFEVFISPHYFYPTDKGWKFNGPLETDEAANGYFARKGLYTIDGLAGSGADWLERFKPFIEDGKTIVVAPHRVWGPETNDLVLQLRKRRISKIILGGMLANLCVESHLRELLEQGFEVAVAKDATAAPKHPEWGYGYTAALINFAFLAHAVWTTDETVKAMEAGS